MDIYWRVYLGVRTCGLFLCFVIFVLLGSIVLTAPFLYCFLCFTSPVSFTGSYTEDEPLMELHNSPTVIAYSDPCISDVSLPILTF